MQGESGNNLEGLTLKTTEVFQVIQEVKRRLREFSMKQAYRISKYKSLKLIFVIPKMASHSQWLVGQDTR